MIRGYWTARTGMMSHQTRMDTIANNMANVSTTAFKPHRSTFKDLIYQNVNRPEAQDSAMVGAGVKVNTNDSLMAQGPLFPTERELDMALLGDGDFFMLEAANGDILYSRAGAFYLQIEDEETAYLVDGSGNRVLDADSEQIELTVVNGRFNFDPQMVGVYRFPNQYGLDRKGDNTYVETAISGTPEAVDNPEYKQGYLEGSSVQISQEMVAVIEASKAFSLSARMSQVADEVEQTINSLR